MVLADISATPDNPHLSPQDSQIADALSAWLAALSLTSPKQTFQNATNPCVSLCQCLTLFAPHLLSERDYFTPTNVSGANVSRQRRYNTRKLARSLATWFNLAPSPTPPTEHIPTSSVQLAPAPQQTITALSDASRTQDIEPQSVILTLAEVLLCAAVHSQKREMFIKAVLTLNSVQQDALAQSIRRTAMEEKQASVLAPVPLNDENLNAIQPPSDDTRTFSFEKLSEPSGIPLADYKALATERDNLRRKLAASEFEKNKAAEVADGLKVNLEEAADKIRELQATEERQQEELAARSSALQEAKNALRDAHVNAEEIDVLRAKAASAEQLEASLKRASKRLEEVAQMRKSTKDLEAQISAFRENEERMAKHAEYLESQLAKSNDRAQQLATLSDDLSAAVEKREKQISELKKDNDELKNKLETTNQQLTSMLLQSTNTMTMTQSKGTSSRSAEAESQLKLQAKGSDVKQTGDEVAGETSASIRAQSEAISEPLKPETIKEMVSDTLYDEIGVRMQWGDIVECVRGVMDALREMDEMEGGQNGIVYRMHSQTNSQMSRPSGEGHEGHGSSHSSSQSLRSEADSHNPEIGSDSESRMSLLPEFGELDSSLAAANGGKGDEFDYAANHVNVKEIPLDNPMIRRRSSQLASIPENREGFHASETDMYDRETSYDSGYLSEGDEELADETVNATIDRNHLRNDKTKKNNPERKSSGSESKDMSPRQPDSPFIATDLLPSSAHMIESQVRSTPVRRCHSLAKDVRRSASLSLSVRSGISRSPSNSETTRSLVRQARNELAGLQKAVELMRTERKSSTSIGTLVQQLEATRNDLSVCQSKLRETESELSDTRKELSAIIKEMDSLTVQRKVERDRESKLLDEKERLLDHLSESLKQKEGEVASCKNEVQRKLEEIEMHKNSEKTLEEKLQAADVIERAHELEIARLNAQIEASDMFTTRLNAVVNRTDGLHSQISRQRESHLNDIAAAARREKELAEEARAEAKRVAKNQESVLQDVRASAAAAAAQKNIPGVELRIHSRKSKFSDFWRRLLHREKVQIDYSMPASTTSLPVVLDRTPRKLSLARSQ